MRELIGPCPISVVADRVRPEPAGGPAEGGPVGQPDGKLRRTRGQQFLDVADS